MSRILKRPMFRNGGKAEGIISGLDTPKRGLVDGPGGYAGEEKEDPRNIFKKKDLISDYKTAQSVTDEIYPQQATNINPFLMNFGLDLMSRSPQGGLLATAAAAAKQPTQQLFKDIDTRKDRKRETEADLFKTLVEARGEALSGEKGNQLAKLAYKDQVIALTDQLGGNYDQFQKGEIDKDTYLRTQSNLVNQMLVFADLDPRIKAKYGTNDSIDIQKSSIKKRILVKNPELAEDPAALEAAILQAFNEQFSADLLSVFTGITYKEPVAVEEKAMGGRIGYANAGPVMPQQPTMAQAPGTMEQEDSETLSYDELRERLPSEITDDIVRLIAESPEALEDFAVIQTQQDVNNFNSKYGVQLTLPPEA
jgi:hypothetical protein